MKTEQFSNSEIVVVWFKRDLRLTDQEPLYYALQQELPVLLLYCFEPSIMNYDDSDTRHWRFVYQSLQGMQTKLHKFNAKIEIFHNEVLEVFHFLINHFKIKTIYSYQETGNKKTYNRDICVAEFCKTNQIEWIEYQNNGVIRKLKSRTGWDVLWKRKMEDTPKQIQKIHCSFLHLNEDTFNPVRGEALSKAVTTPDTLFQPGGETFVWRYLETFIKTRHLNYSKNLSKPAFSRESCTPIALSGL